MAWNKVLGVLLLAAVCIVVSVEAQNTYSFAILSDIHIGDNAANATEKAKFAVAKINSNVQSKNIKFVFITGDLTNSATRSQYSTVHSILSALTVPFYPSIGNHDTWQYNSTWEEPTPTGDALFAETFREQMSKVTFYNNETVWNPEENIKSWFQNWELRVGGISFLSLDWNSRHHAVSALGYKGAMPGAQLHDFPGGTLPFLASRLQALPADIKKVVLLQHHPFRSPWYIPEWYSSGCV